MHSAYREWELVRGTDGLFSWEFLDLFIGGPCWPGSDGRKGFGISPGTQVGSGVSSLCHTLYL